MKCNYLGRVQPCKNTALILPEDTTAVVSFCFPCFEYWVKWAYGENNDYLSKKLKMHRFKTKDNLARKYLKDLKLKLLLGVI